MLVTEFFLGLFHSNTAAGKTAPVSDCEEVGAYEALHTCPAQPSKD